MSRMTETWHYLFVAVLALAAGSESLAERLARAYEAGLQRAVTETEWPANMQAYVAELQAQLKRIVPIDLHGVDIQALKAAFADADPNLVRSIARRTVLLYRRLIEESAR
ncbi:MAG: hypothetical protein ACLGHO_06585 [Gammaproteobacteria bacterium]